MSAAKVATALPTPTRETRPGTRHWPPANRAAAVTIVTTVLISILISIGLRSLTAGQRSKRVSIRTIIRAACGLALIGVIAGWTSAQEKMEESSLEQAIAAAQRTQRPIFVIGGGESCPYCR